MWERIGDIGFWVGIWSSVVVCASLITFIIWVWIVHVMNPLFAWAGLM